MSKQNQILAIVLAVQLVLIAVVFWPRSAASGAGDQAFFTQLDQVTSLTIRDPEGQEIRLRIGRFDPQGGTGWVLPEADDYPCQQERVSKFLDQVAQLKANRLVTRTAASHKRLKVSEVDFERLIALEWADGTTHKLYLGTSPSYRAMHVRVDDQDEVYLVSELSVPDAGTGPLTWIDSLYFSVPQEQIVALALENANGRFEFARVPEAPGAEGAWTMAGLAADEMLNENNVTSLVSRIAALRMLRPLGKTEQESYGIKTPNALITVQTQDQEGKVQTSILRVGARSEEDQSYVVISSQSPYYVNISEYTVKDFVERQRQDFIEQPPTTAPEQDTSS
jgi:hypothetical protein